MSRRAYIKRGKIRRVRNIIRGELMELDGRIGLHYQLYVDMPMKAARTLANPDAIENRDDVAFDISEKFLQSDLEYLTPFLSQKSVRKRLNFLKEVRTSHDNLPAFRKRCLRHQRSELGEANG